MNYSVGDHVRRVEGRLQVSAVVIAVEQGLDEQLLELSYEEGGTGWWPACAVEPDAAS